MDVSIAITVVGLLFQLIGTVVVVSHYSGKYEQKVNNHDASIREVFDMALKNANDLAKHKENHTTLKEQVAVNDTRLTESMNGMRREMQELKETLKEFTSEMKEWIKTKN